jgi:hypothetical protein
MKLRLKGNSVRLRLTKTEVTNLVRVGIVEESSQIGSSAEGCLRYRLESNPHLEALNSRFENGVLVVEVPAAAAADWANGELVGLYAEMLWGLKIAVEKDFRCLDATRRDDEADAFENPGPAPVPLSRPGVLNNSGPAHPQ